LGVELCAIGNLPKQPMSGIDRSTPALSPVVIEPVYRYYQPSQ
jgi:hypothetical protein